MANLESIEGDVLHYLSKIDESFNDEFSGINSTDFTALINLDGKVLGLGKSQTDALSNVAEIIGYNATTNIFVQGLFNRVKLTNAAFDLMLKTVDDFYRFPEVGGYRMSNVCIDSTRAATEVIDSLLKSVDEAWGFSFEIKNIEEDDVRQAFIFDMSVAGHDLDGGFVKGSVIEKGQWFAAKQNLSHIAGSFRKIVRHSKEASLLGAVA